MQAVPPPMTGNYLPSGPDIEIDDSQYTYGLEKTQPSESESQTKELDTCNSNISAKTSKLVSEPVVNESNIEFQPKVWSDAPIIEEYDNQIVMMSNDNPHRTLKNKGIIDSGCSRHMTGNKAYLADFQDFNGGPVAFGGSKGYITGKGKIKTGKLDFEDVSFVKELQHFNLFSVSQMCDKKNKVLFTDTECLVLSPDFKLPDENQILLKVPRQNNMYSFNLENIVPLGGLACLIAKATTDESNKWHRRIKRENNKARTPQQNGVSERKNRTLLRQQGTMLANHLLTRFCAEQFRLNLLQCKKKEANEEAEALRKNLKQETENLVTQAGAAKPSISTASTNKGLSISDTTNSQEDDYEIPPLEDIHEDTTDGIFTHSSYDDEGAEADFTNLETVVNVSPIPTSRINPSHPSALILGDPTSAVQTRSKVNKSSEAHAFVSYVQKQRRNNHKDFHHCLFACFLSQHEPKKISEALEDESWVDAMQEELLQFEIQKVWILVDLPYGKKAIGTKWVYRNKKDERGVVVRNKTRLVARLEAIRIFLAFASYMGFIVYQMDVKSAFLYGKIDEEISDEFNGRAHFLSWTTIETQKPLVKDEEASDVDVHLYRKSTIGGCQFLGRRLITWQCKKQTIVATSTTEAEYVAAASCCGQVVDP
ncbi:ribonuclease H-like domain-containing protein [Tanacetum coccineum]